MPSPPSYLTREQKIKTHAQMVDTLKARVKAVQSPQAKLTWLKPVSNPNGTGHQLAGGTDYAIRKVPFQDEPMYWAWFGRKLLGYSRDVEIARTHCEAHWMNNRAR